MNWADVIEVARARGASGEGAWLGVDSPAGRVALGRETILGQPAVAIVLVLCKQRQLSAEVALVANGSLPIGAVLLQKDQYLVRCALALEGMSSERLGAAIDTLVRVVQKLRASLVRTAIPTGAPFLHLSD